MHVAERLSNAADAIIALDQEMSSVRDEIMDAQNSSQDAVESCQGYSSKHRKSLQDFKQTGSCQDPGRVSPRIPDEGSAAACTFSQTA